MRNQLLIDLYKKPQTVFTLKDVSLWFPEIPYNNLKERMSYFVSSGGLKKLRKGVYAKDQFNVFELANRLYVPSYISLETVLQKAGVTFQYYKSIFSISYLSRTININENLIVYVRIRKEILLNKQGIEEDGVVILATPERAFLDTIYVYPNYYFDNLRPFNWDMIFKLKDIYASSVFNKRVEEYYKIYKEDHV